MSTPEWTTASNKQNKVKFNDKCAHCKRRNVSILRGFCNVCEALWMAKGTEMSFYLNKLTEVEIAQMTKEEKERFRYIDSEDALKTWFSYRNLTIDDLIEKS